MKAAGWTAIFVNIRDYPENQWTIIRQRAQSVGMICGPWARTAKGENDRIWAPEIFELVIDTGERWQQPCVPNCESEIDHSGSTITKWIQDEIGDRKDVAISTLARPMQAVDWHPLSDIPILGQLFVESLQTDPDNVKPEWHAAGIKCFYGTYGAYGGRTPENYPRVAPYSVYTADDVAAGNFAKWAPLSTGYKPCKEEVPVPDAKEWYEKPYLTGDPVGPAKLPRPLKPPKNNNGLVASGDDVMAFKRAISRAGRLKPWEPATWSPAYGDAFALGKGTGNVGDSGVQGFQRQAFPDDKSKHTGNIGDETYQKIRRVRVSDPASPNYKKPILDFAAVNLLINAAKEFDTGTAIEEFRKHLADFCERAEQASSAAWTYSQRRPFTGLGQPPEVTHVNDCSSYCVLAYYWGRTNSGLSVDDPSGYEYHGFGNTWDDLDGHPRVTSGNYLVGDLAHYGSGGTGHVTICRKAGNKDTSVWSSFGQEPKPEKRDLFYRPDFIKVVRPSLD